VHGAYWNAKWTEYCTLNTAHRFYNNGSCGQFQNAGGFWVNLAWNFGHARRFLSKSTSWYYQPVEGQLALTPVATRVRANWSSPLATKMQSLLKEVVIWAMASAGAGLIAGTALGAVLSGGEFARGMIMGALVGGIGGAGAGALLRLALEGVWAAGAHLMKVLYRMTNDK